MEWFLERLQQANPAFDYQDLCNHKKDFKKLLELHIIKYTQQLETIECDLCDDEHFVSPFKNKAGEIVLSCSGSRRVVDPDELKVWIINKEVLVDYVKSKNPVISKVQYDQTTYASKRIGEFRIEKRGDDFYYNGDLRTQSKEPDWYKVFSALYYLVPNGGEVSYAKLGAQIKSTIKKTKDYEMEKMRKFISTNLTDKSNGFVHYAGIPDVEDDGKKLLSVRRGKGVIFNNRIS